MIIPKGSKLTAEQVEEIERIASDFECSILEIQGRNRCVYAILGMKAERLCSRELPAFLISGKWI